MMKALRNRGPSRWTGRTLHSILRQGLLGMALGAAFVLTLSLASAQAPYQDPQCGYGPPGAASGDQHCGNMSLVSEGSGPVSGGAQVTGPSGPAAGALVYTDYVALEEKARGLLEPNLAFRESISPYNSKPDFVSLVMKFDYKAGFTKVIPGTTETLQARIDRADKELREARDLYAFLAVYAPVDRFRKDAAYITTVPAGKTEPLCGAVNKEDPNPPDKLNRGQVLPPVIDWCDFTARLRQSVRESANIRMVFAQQFVVDALGLHFSGTDFKGGDVWVRDEVAKLRAAEYQYNLVQAGIAEALDRPLGSGCVVSDFFTQAEWSLMSEAAESKETAQHHIAVRQSYLGDVVADNTSEKDVAKAQADATNTYRSAAADGHIKLIGLAGIGVGAPTGSGCPKAARPDGLLVAEMAANMLKTREEARKLSQHRNIFGFDITFIPARPYSLGPGGATEGLLEEAYRLTGSAQALQNNEVANSRAFDQSEKELLAAVEGVRTATDGAIYSTFGCAKPGSGGVTDAMFFDCADKQVEYLQKCLDLIDTPTVAGAENAFDKCMKDPAVLEGDAKRSLRDLRGVWLAQNGIQLRITNLAERISISKDANIKVMSTIGTNGAIQTAKEVAAALGDSITTITGVGFAGTMNKPGAASDAVWAATAGASSTAADIYIQDVGAHVEIKNMLLDISESWVELQGARQAYLAKLSEFQDSLGNDLMLEARRQRAYLQNSPQNDPSLRIVRDSSRLQLAKALEHAARIAYLASRRGEYEKAARLSVSGFRISDIYRARTAEDIRAFLDSLKSKLNSLPGSATNPDDYPISVAVDVLGLSNDALAKEGFTGAAAQAERIRRFRIWVGEHTVANHPSGNGKPALVFKFLTNVQEGGIFANSYGAGFSGLWLQKIAGVGAPFPTNTGLSADVFTEEKGMVTRTIWVTQGGLVQLRAKSGCILDYHLMEPAFLLGLEWSQGQDPETVTATFKANVNGESTSKNGLQSSDLVGRAISGTDWEVTLFSAGTTGGASLPNMDLQKLTDVVLNFSTTYASRGSGAGIPTLSECVKIDF